MVLLCLCELQHTMRPRIELPCRCFLPRLGPVANGGFFLSCQPKLDRRTEADPVKTALFGLRTIPALGKYLFHSISVAACFGDILMT